MRLSTLRLIALVLLGTCPALVVGCGTSKPANFYLLQPIRSPAPADRSAGVINGILVGVGPITIPDYLDRPEIVTLSGQCGLKLAEFERWPESLQKTVVRVLAENLSVLLRTDRVAVFPWPPQIHPDYQVSVDITRFDALPDGRVILTAGWTLYGEDGENALAMRKSRLSVSVDSPGVEGIVLAQSRAIEALSREIASSIEPGSQSLQAQGSP